MDGGDSDTARSCSSCDCCTSTRNDAADNSCSKKNEHDEKKATSPPSSSSVSTRCGHDGGGIGSGAASLAVVEEEDVSIERLVGRGSFADVYRARMAADAAPKLRGGATAVARGGADEPQQREFYAIKILNDRYVRLYTLTLRMCLCLPLVSCGMGND